MRAPPPRRQDWDARRDPIARAAAPRQDWNARGRQAARTEMRAAAPPPRLRCATRHECARRPVPPPPTHLGPGGRRATHLEQTTICSSPSDLTSRLLADNIPCVDILRKNQLQTSSPGRGSPAFPVPPL